MTRVTRIRVWPRDPATGTEIAYRLAGGGHAFPYLFDAKTAETDHYRAGVVNGPRFTARLGFDENGWTGGTTPATSAIGFATADAALLEVLSALYWTDARIEIDEGPEGTALTRVLTGTIADATIDDHVITITAADLSARLDKPVLRDRFLGNGGVEGIAEAGGRAKRRSWGRVFNVEARVLDKANNIYELGDPARPLNAITALRDKGRAGPFTVIGWQGSIAATLAALVAAVPAQGGGVAAPSIACVKWWTQPAGPLTADLQGETGTGYVETVCAIADRLLAEFGPITVDALATAIAARPEIAGIHVGDENESVAQAVDRLLLGSSMLWLLQPSGNALFRQWSFSAPAIALHAEFEGRRRSFAPIRRRRLGWQRNHRIHNDAEISAAVESARALDLIADRSQVKYNGAGLPSPAAQTTTFSVLKQAINSPVAIVVARSDGTLPPLSIGSYFTALDGGAEVLNRAVDSIDFSAWTANAATVTPAAATAPDGTRTASLVEDSGIADNGAISQTIAIPVDSATYNVSIYVKKTVVAAASAMLRVNMGGGLDPLPQASKDAILNTNTGAVRGVNAPNIRADSVGDYWRLSFDAANNGTNSVATYIFYPAIGLNQGDEAALGPDPAATGAAHAWGMQIGDQPGQPHVPTAGAARTALLSNSVRITEPGFAAARGATNGLIVQAIASEPGGVLTDYAGLVAVGDGAPGFDGAAGIDGIDGADGKLVEFVWRRAATQPDTPTGNGIPAGWFDDPPAGDDPLWLSKAKQELDGSLVAGEAWSAPIRHDGPAGAPGAPGATGVSIRKIWQRSTTQPATPAASDATPAGWFDTPGAASGSGTLWATTGERAAGAVNFTWTTPVRDEAITSTNTGQFVVLGFTVSETISFTLSPGQSRQIFGQANLSSPTGGGSAHVQIESRLNGGAWSASNGPSEPYAVGEPAVLEHSITITNSALVSANYQVRGTVIRSNTSSGSLVTSSSQLSI